MSAKIEIIIKYLKEHIDHDYKLYNHLCLGMEEQDLNIIDYAKYVLDLINLLIDNKLRQALFTDSIL